MGCPQQGVRVYTAEGLGVNCRKTGCPRQKDRVSTVGGSWDICLLYSLQYCSSNKMSKYVHLEGKISACNRGKSSAKLH